ncbi:grpE protein homolog 1, mitochondrial-like isoform X1 [Saccostrea echinata]|uniref:grpE protein homolog 1, mitochondrial-like isoform X1 n=1 Tax=Saccostrea echinata TaxID=191078 RepID=UPI002A81A6A4|nr:grpE protein homolog 1, mitochondrial-like isoform X1 [Saccostrea echinata]
MATIGGMCVRTVISISRSLRQNNYQRVTWNRLQSGQYCTTNSDAKGDKSEKSENTSDESQKVIENLTAEGEKLKTQANDFKGESWWYKMSGAGKKLFQRFREDDNWKDKYMRALAETENVRQRMSKQVTDTKLFGIQGFCKDLLEVADILQQATQSIPEEELKKNKHLEDLFNGLVMTEAQLQKVFLKHGLEQIIPQKGEKFDPHLHEALFQVPAEDPKMASSVATLEKLGYKLHERTLRPALVGVFKS